MKKNKEKVFVIINSYLVGDMLLVNSLVQNIKRIYKDSKVVMLTSPNLVELSKYQKDVDDVIIWDRAGKHKGFFGMLKFIKNFPYKKIYASFPIYAMDRPIMLGLLLGSKYNLFGYKKNILRFLKKEKYKTPIEGATWQEKHLNLLKGITKEKLIDCPIQYFVDKNTTLPVENLKDYIALCPVSSKVTKDMSKETVLEIIKSTDKKVAILGNGQVSRELSQELKKENLENLIDLTDKTTLQQAAWVIKNSSGVIAVDTGLMHMSCALNKPTVAVFYNTNENFPFVPNKKLYKAKSIFKDQNANNILKELNTLTSKELING